MGVVAFWIALAAVIVARSWLSARREAMKHETLRRIVEKTGQVDEAQFKALFQPPPLHCPPDHPWFRPPPPGGAYRGLRVFGSLAMFVALGLAIFFVIVLQTGAEPPETAMIGFACTAVIGLFGAGLFFASRFMPRPPPPAPPGKSERP